MKSLIKVSCNASTDTIIRHVTVTTHLNEINTDGSTFVQMLIADDLFTVKPK